MKISLAWLKNSHFLHWPETLSVEKLSMQLPMAGFEVDSIAKIEDDYVLDLSITANRGDCLSLRGLSREIACLNQLMFNDILVKEETTNFNKASSFIRIDAKAACAIYSGRFIRHINNQKKLPEEIIDRLTKSGIESINPIVDICNYVMLELGQPLHAFDAQSIQGIHVRFAKTGEKLKVLGGQSLNLQPNTLLVTNHVDQPLAIAGVIGGLDASVTEHTHNIFLESAHFVPEFIAGRARQYGLQTEAAIRFERGVDPFLPLIALQYASDLIVQHLGGELDAIQTTMGTSLPSISSINLRPKRIERILGMNIEADTIFHTLTALGMSVKALEDYYEIHPPSFRFDLRLEVDLIEELARIHGYEHIPINPPQINQISTDPFVRSKNLLNQYLVNAGYQEIISYSFISEDLQKLCFGDKESLRLQNPLSNELAIMRTSLWPSLLSAWNYNAKRQQSRACFFELGTVYENIWETVSHTVKQQPVLGGLITGSRLPEQWSDAKKVCDFFDLKKDVENLLHIFFSDKKIDFRANPHSMLHPGQAAEIFVDSQLIGRMGRLHPKLQQYFELEAPVFLFELFLNTFPKISHKKFQSISRFPSVRRDFAFLMPRTQAVGDVVEFVQQTLGVLCREVILFDVYEGKNMPIDQKSIAFGIVLQSLTETLADETVNQLSTKLINALEEKFKAQLRS